MKFATLQYISNNWFPIPPENVFILLQIKYNLVLNQGVLFEIMYVFGDTELICHLSANFYRKNIYNGELS